MLQSNLFETVFEYMFVELWHAYAWAVTHKYWVGNNSVTDFAIPCSPVKNFEKRITDCHFQNSAFTAFIPVKWRLIPKHPILNFFPSV